VTKRVFDSFLSYLKEKSKAGIAETDNCTVYFIPQESGAEFGIDLQNFLLGVLISKKKESSSMGSVLSRIINKPTT